MSNPRMDELALNISDKYSTSPDRTSDSGGKDDDRNLFPVLQLPNLLSQIADCFCICFEVGDFGVNRLKLAQQSSFEGIDPPIQFGEFKVCIRKPCIYLTGTNPTFSQKLANTSISRN